MNAPIFIDLRDHRKRRAGIVLPSLLAGLSLAVQASAVDLGLVWTNPTNHTDGTPLDTPALIRVAYTPAALMVQWGTPMSGVRVATNSWLAPLAGQPTNHVTVEMTNNLGTEQKLVITNVPAKLYAVRATAICGHGESESTAPVFAPAGSPAAITIRVSK
ncbi:MAG: hypothetical protein K8T26_18610 [Lentisphaerae bacterium]|nr:hypothetical protein [Lentisphaerota bacterium]